MLGVAVTVIVVDGCYRAYKHRKERRNFERELGLTPEVRRELRRQQREQDRQRKQREKDWRRRMRQQERARANGTWDGIEIPRPPDEYSELPGMGLPEYSLRPRDGVDRAVSATGAEGLTMNGQKKKGIRKLFKRVQSEPEPIVEGEAQRMQKKKKVWFKRKKGGRNEEHNRAVVVEAPPPYEVIAGEMDGGPVGGTSTVPARSNSA